MYTISGTVAVITGGARGTGLAPAKALAAEGAKLVIADIEATALNKAVAELSSAGAKAEDVMCGAADLASLQSLAEQAFSKIGCPWSEPKPVAPQNFIRRRSRRSDVIGDQNHSPDAKKRRPDTRPRLTPPAVRSNLGFPLSADQVLRSRSRSVVRRIPPRFFNAGDSQSRWLSHGSGFGQAVEPRALDLSA